MIFLSEFLTISRGMLVVTASAMVEPLDHCHESVGNQDPLQLFCLLGGFGALTVRQSFGAEFYLVFHTNSVFLFQCIGELWNIRIIFVVKGLAAAERRAVEQGVHSNLTRFEEISKPTRSIHARNA